MAAPANWPDITLPNNDQLLDQRICLLRWYRAGGGALRSENQFLLRSIVVKVTGVSDSLGLRARILRYVATKTGRQPDHFTIAAIDPTFGDFILICPSIGLRDYLTEVRTWYLNMHTPVSFAPWHHGLNLVYAPTTFRAIIQLTGVPLNLWNRPDLRSLVSELCYPEEIEPHFVNDNYSSMRMLVKCHHPTNISHYIHSNDAPWAQPISVTLLGYIRVREDGDNGNDGLPQPPPPPDMPPPPPYQCGQAAESFDHASNTPE